MSANDRTHTLVGCGCLVVVALIALGILGSLLDEGDSEMSVPTETPTPIAEEGPTGRVEPEAGAENRLESYVTECDPVYFGEYSSTTLDALGKLLRVGDTLRETLRAGDFVGDDGAFVDYWALQVCEDTQIDIEMTSSAVDAMLLLGRGWDTGPGFDLITYSDDYTDYSTDARVGSLQAVHKGGTEVANPGSPSRCSGCFRFATDWACPAFRDGHCSGLMVSLMWLLLSPLQRWRGTTSDWEEAGEPEKSSKLSVAPALQVRLRPHG